MKIYLPTFLAVLVSGGYARLLSPSVSGDDEDCPVTEFCVGKDDESRCEAGGGQCLEATRMYLDGQPGLAIDLFKYGKYCGRDNRCTPYEMEATPCFDPPEACGAQDSSSESVENASPDAGIDSACEVHDLCLDVFIDQLEKFDPEDCARSTGFRNYADINFLNGLGVVPGLDCKTDINGADRISCDARLASGLATAYSVSSSPTGLCEADFYTVPVSDQYPTAAINIIGHESFLVAAPFCCSSILNGCSYTPNDPNCSVATGFCTNIESLCPSR